MSASASAAAGHGTLRPVRVLIVDDSAFARLVIARKLAADPEIEIAGYAADGAEAVEQIALLEPDVLTMDVEMPGTDGLTGLKRIMAECPTPVVMLSSLTSEGAGVTLQALDLGAVDFFMKPSASNPAGMAQAVAELQTKVKSAAHVSSDALRRLLTTARIKRRVTPPSRPKLGAPQSIVVIGVVLTGMGSDGTEGARAIKEQGGQVVVEHESSCTVYGMPKSVADAGYADRVAVLPRIAGAIMEMVSARAAVATGGGGR